MPCGANWLAMSPSIWVITSPELRPGLGVPVNSADVNPLKRSNWVGPLRNSVRTSAETGIIASARPRT